MYYSKLLQLFIVTYNTPYASSCFSAASNDAWKQSIRTDVSIYRNHFDVSVLSGHRLRQEYRRYLRLSWPYMRYAFTNIIHSYTKTEVSTTESAD